MSENFQESQFKKMVQLYCRLHKWVISDISDEWAALKFRLKSGRVQLCMIRKFGSTIEFAVPSALMLDESDTLPHELSTVLLLKNSRKTVGFWCIESMGSKRIYTVMHNEDMQLLNEDTFRRIVVALIRECDEFEGIMSRSNDDAS